MSKVEVLTRVSNRPNHTLMLVWPPYNTPMAYQTLKFFTGSTVIYVGEGDGGCTGCDRFHGLLNSNFEQVEFVSIPRWECIYDSLRVYRRKSYGDTFI